MTALLAPHPNCALTQVAETLPTAVLDKIKPVPRDDSGPIITAEELPGFDGLIFGMPTRFGMMPSQVEQCSGGGRGWGKHSSRAGLCWGDTPWAELASGMGWG